MGENQEIKIRESLQAVFREVFDDDGLLLSEELTAEGYEAWDSLLHIQLVAAAEKKFRVKFTTREILKLKNAEDFVRLIAGKLS
ncbi:MAG: acyl carrier protein [Clostridium sp.]|jgi:acyl carrier protein|nr:acyl carrier protein [Clostridium sp.]